jgi:hypothetical protein
MGLVGFTALPLEGEGRMIPGLVLRSQQQTAHFSPSTQE